MRFPEPKAWAASRGRGAGAFYNARSGRCAWVIGTNGMHGRLDSTVVGGGLTDPYDPSPRHLGVKAPENDEGSARAMMAMSVERPNSLGVALL